MTFAKILFPVASLVAITFASQAAHAAACTSKAVSSSAILSWKPPVKAKACTQTDATAFDTAFNDPQATPDTIEASVSGACNACIFTENASSSASWQLMVWVDKANKKGIFNPGACVAAAQGKNDCAATSYQVDECNNLSCAACTDQATYDTCQQAAEAGTCSSYLNASQTACDTSVEPALKLCDLQQGGGASIAKMVMELCGTTSTGGGSGGGSGNGGGSGGGSGNGGGSGSGTGGGTGSGTGSGTGNQGQTQSPGLGLNSAPNTGGCSTSGNSSPSEGLAAFGLAAIALTIVRRRRASV